MNRKIMLTLRFRSIVVILFLLFSASISLADSWFPFTKIEFKSPNSKFRLEVLAEGLFPKISNVRIYEMGSTEPISEINLDYAPCYAFVNDKGYIITVNRFGPNLDSDEGFRIYDKFGNLKHRIPRTFFPVAYTTISHAWWYYDVELSEDGNFICFSNERRELFIVNIETGESRKVSPEEMKQYLPYSILPPKISDEKALKKAKWRLRQLGLKPEQFSIDNGMDEKDTRKFVAATFSEDGKALGPITIWIDLQTGKVVKEDLGDLKDKLQNR